MTNERSDTDYYFLSTVNANMEYFNRVDIEGADRAHNLKQLLGWPSDQQLINKLSRNLIINYPFLSDDARRVHAIYGPATAILKDKIMRKKPKHVEFKQRITIKEEILKHHCFINGQPYLTTITGKVNYRTII